MRSSVYKRLGRRHPSLCWPPVAHNYYFPSTNSSGLAMGVALTAPDASQPVSTSLTLHNQQGQMFSNEPPQMIQPNGHTSFVLPVRSSLPQNMRGVGEFDSPSGPIFGLGIRSHDNAFTSVDAVLPQ